MIYLLPFIAAFIGWLTNFIAVKMLFHPRKPLYFLGIKVQGVFPKRQLALAKKLGVIVSEELFSSNDIVDAINNESSRAKIMEVVNVKVDEFIVNKLPQKLPMLAMFLSQDLKTKVKNTLVLEIEEMLPNLIEGISTNVKENIDVEKTVYNKVANFSVDKFEDILFAIMKKEFRLIEVLGGVLGFLIGIIQVLLIKLT